MEDRDRAMKLSERPVWRKVGLEERWEVWSEIRREGGNMLQVPRMFKTGFIHSSSFFHHANLSPFMSAMVVYFSLEEAIYLKSMRESIWRILCFVCREALASFQP